MVLPLAIVLIIWYSGNENETSATKNKKCDRIVVCDPNHNEEAIMDGKLVLGINPYKEICLLHLAGKMIIDKVMTYFRQSEWNSCMYKIMS